MGRAHTKEDWPFRWIWECPIDNCKCCSKKPLNRSVSLNSGRKHMIKQHGSNEEPKMTMVVKPGYERKPSKSL